MLPTKPSNTKNSSILAMGKKLAEASKESGKEYLMLNRGICSVTNINLNNIVKTIDFNSHQIQHYPGSNGKIELRKAINKEFFDNQAELSNIIITSGGISGLDIIFQNLDVNEIILPRFFWGTYIQLLNLRKISFSNYNSFDELKSTNLKNKAVLICDPGNPLGEKYDDYDLLEIIRYLDSVNCTIIIDSPYRRLFYNQTDSFYQQLLDYRNVIITESFSKSIGLSGQRIGFIHANDKNFIKEASLRITYATNGINSVAQVLVTKLLTTPEGTMAVDIYKNTTIENINKNLKYLQEQNLLANEFYINSKPKGIFAVINKSSEILFQNRIGSVELNYFTNQKKQEYNSFSRILVAIPHEKFVSFFRTI